MGSSFRRKSYGKVRPVPKIKVKAPERPKVQELASLYRLLDKTPEHQVNDILAQALAWWVSNAQWFMSKYAKAPMTLTCAKYLSISGNESIEGQHATDNKAKTKHFVKALNAYSTFAAPLLKTPKVQPFTKKSKEITKKSNAASVKLADRFKPTLELLAQCFPSCKMSFKVVPEIKKHNEYLDWLIDHELSTIFLTRAFCKEMQQRIWREGLLAVVIDLGQNIARAMSIDTSNKNGTFLVDEAKVYAQYISLLKDFAKFAGTEDAPNKLIKRKSVKIKKSKSILDSISDEETKAFMDNAIVVRGKGESDATT